MEAFKDFMLPVLFNPDNGVIPLLLFALVGFFTTGKGAITKYISHKFADAIVDGIAQELKLDEDKAFTGGLKEEIASTAKIRAKRRMEYAVSRSPIKKVISDTMQDDAIEKAVTRRNKRGTKGGR